MHYLFVYGTLMRRQGNNHYLHNAKYIGEAITIDKFAMSVNSVPFLSRTKHRYIKGELYKVSDDILKEVDRLEGHPNFYTREKIQVLCNNIIVDCWCYFYYGFEGRLNRSGDFNNLDLMN